MKLHDFRRQRLWGSVLDASQASMLAARILTYALAALAAMVMARALGPTEFGYYASASAITGLLLAFGSAGVDQLYLQRRLTDGEVDYSLRRVALASMLVTGVALLAWPGLDLRTRACGLALGAVLSLERLRQRWLLKPQRGGIFQIRALRELAGGAAMSVAAAAIAVITSSSIAVTLGALAAAILVSWYAARREGLSRGTPVPLGSTLRAGRHYALSSLLFGAYFLVDGTMIASIAGERDAGQYRVAYSILSVALVVAAALNNEVLRPRLYGATDEAAFTAIRRRFLKTNLGLASGFMVAGVLLGSATVTALFGDEYRDAGKILPVLALGAMPHFLNSYLGNTYVASGLVGLVLRIQSAALVLNVAGNLYAIRSWGARGAAGMTILTESLVLVAYAAVFPSVQRATRENVLSPRSKEPPTAW